MGTIIRKRVYNGVLKEMEDGIDMKRKSLLGRMNYTSNCTAGRMMYEEESKKSEQTAPRDH